MMKHIKQLTANIWWAYVTKETKSGTEFEGDMWEGSNAEAIARAWFDARSERPA